MTTQPEDPKEGFPEGPVSAAPSIAGDSLSISELGGPEKTPDVTTWRRELRALFDIGWPVALRFICRLSMVLTDLIFLGHLGTDDLAAGAVASVWMIVTSAFLYRGFGTALSTLAAQAYGAENYHSVGHWLQLAIVSTTIACLPILGSWVFTTPILAGVGIDVNTARLAGTFAFYSMIGLWPLSIYFLLAAYLQAQGNVVPALVVNASMVGVNIGLNQLFIHGAPSWGWNGLGFVGSPLATSVSRWGVLVVFFLYIVIRGLHRKTWGGWSAAAFEKPRLKEYLLRQTVPMAIGSCLEEWQLQVVGVFAARLGDVQIATHNAMLEVFFFMTSIMFGLLTATSVRIGQHLGAGLWRSAQRSSRVALGCSVVIALVTATLFITLRNELGKIFSDDPRVLALASQLSFVVGACYVFLAIFYVSMAMLEGQARPTMVAVAFAIGAWLVAVPLSYVFGFVLHYDLMGLWYGLTCGYSVVTIIAGVAAYRSNWPALAIDAMERSRKKTKKSEEHTQETDPLLPSDTGVNS